jgi:hypothetical protein
VKDLEIDAVHFDIKGPDMRPAMVCEDVDGLAIEDLQAKVSKGILPAWFDQVSHVTIRNSPKFTKVPTTRPTTGPSSLPTTDPDDE